MKLLNRNLSITAFVYWSGIDASFEPLCFGAIDSHCFAWRTTRLLKSSNGEITMQANLLSARSVTVGVADAWP